MEQSHEQWLLAQLPALVQEQVLSEEAAGRLERYYAPASAPAAKPAGETDAGKAASPGKGAPHKGGGIIIVLSVLASLLIAGGIISLIAYNWAAIGRGAKSAAAVLLLLAAQGACAFLTFRKKGAHVAVREGASLFWALLFGGVVAFVSQILRLPGNPALFVLVWAASCILIRYATRAWSVFFLSLCMAIVFVAVAKEAGTGCAPFYALFAALMPVAFARPSPRLRYLLLAVAAVMLGFVLEKDVPGLWMPCYAAFAACCASSRSRPVRWAGLAALAVLAFCLSYAGWWEGIGWRHLRPGADAAGIAADVALTLALLACALFRPIRSLVRGEPPSLAHATALFPLAVAALYVWYAAIPDGHPAAGFLAPWAMALLLCAAIGAVAVRIRLPACYAGVPLVWLQLLLSTGQPPLVTVPALLLGTLVLVSLRGRFVPHSPRLAVERTAAYATVRALACLIVAVALIAHPHNWYSWARFAEGSSALYGLLTVVLALAGAATVAWDVLRHREYRGLDSAALLLLFLCAMGISALSLCLSRPPIDSAELQRIGGARIVTAVHVVLLGVTLLYAVIAFFLWRRRGRAEYVPALFLAGIAMLSLWPDALAGNAALFRMLAILLLVLCAQVYGLRARNRGVRTALSVSSALCGGICLLVLSYCAGSELVMEPAARYWHAWARSIAWVLLALFFAAVAAHGAYRLAQGGIICNVALPLAIVLAVMLLAFARKIAGTYEARLAAEPVVNLAFFGLLVLFLLYYVVQGYRRASLAIANAATICMGLAILLRFFTEGYSLVAKGLLFIALGIIILLLNLYLVHRRKTQ